MPAILPSQCVILKCIRYYLTCYYNMVFFFILDTDLSQPQPLPPQKKMRLTNSNEKQRILLRCTPTVSSSNLKKPLTIA